MEKAFEILKNKGVVLISTDSIPGISTLANNKEGIERIKKLKERPDDKSFICLVGNINQVFDLIEKPSEVGLDIMELANQPTTVVFSGVRKMYQHLASEDNSLGVRLVQEGALQKLINKLRIPMVSTSINKSGQASAITVAEVDPDILNGVDACIEPLEALSEKPSSIIKIKEDGQFKILRP